MSGKDARSLSAEVQAEIRILAVEAVKKGRSQSEVAEIFGVTRQAVVNWVSTARKRGLGALKAKPEGRPIGSGRRLSRKQEKQVIRSITEHSPDELDLPFVLWTRAAVQQLIEIRYGLALGLSTVGDYLRRWCFTPQRPAKKAWQQDSRQIRRWLEVEYPKIQQRAKQEKARVYWGDETGCRSDHLPGRTYSPQGKTPVVAINGCRFSCSVISAINNSGNLAFLVFKDSFVTEVFLDFLKRLVRQVKQKVFLIVDGHPVHRGKEVGKWLEENKSRIEVFFLPGYSPDLNPDEYLNQDLKANAFKDQKPENQQQLIQQVRTYLFSRQKQPLVIQAFFHHPSVLYAA
jgi:transposase